MHLVDTTEKIKEFWDSLKRLSFFDAINLELSIGTRYTVTKTMIGVDIVGFIKDIYDGEISGAEDFGFNGSSEFRQLQAKKADTLEKIETGLAEDKKKLLDLLLETEHKIGSIELSRMFEFAFRVGFTAAMDIMKK